MNNEQLSMAGWLPHHNKAAHKGVLGKLGILCGSRQYRGAAILCAEAALRCGAGMVQMASVEPVCNAVTIRLPVCTLLPISENEVGGIEKKGAKMLLEQNPKAIVAGCGLGNTQDTAYMVEALLENDTIPLVLDADALNVLAGNISECQEDVKENIAKTLSEKLSKRKAATIITPHIGEMARLCRCTVAEVTENQQEIAEKYAKTHECIVVLKSYRTVIAFPQKQTFIHDEGGNPGLAKAGSGDVLAGTIGSLLSQGVSADKAAMLGVWLHAKAGQKLLEKMGVAGMLPQDIPTQLAKVIKKLQENKTI